MSGVEQVWKPREINSSVFEEARRQNFSLIASRVLAARFQSESALVEDSKSLAALSNPATLPDMDRAAERIAKAVINGEFIGLATDHDSDGITSCAVLSSAMTDFFGHPRNKLDYYISHRLKDGYGLTDSLVDRILAANPRPTLIITADKASSNEPQIKRLKDANIDVVVTDHHELPEDGYPKSAYACVTPARPDSQYPDKHIAGCMVAWLTMTQVRRKLIALKHLSEKSIHLGELLEYVAVGTIADCVSLSKSNNNRLVVRHGLQSINQSKKPVWKVVREQITKGAAIQADTLAFGLCPRLAASGRMAEAAPGINFLLAKDDATASTIFTQLDLENQERRAVERALVDEALVIAAEQASRGALAIVCHFPNGHAGVHGIVASRIVEKFGRPVICLSPKGDDRSVLAGSCRTVDGVHIRDALQFVAHKDPGVMVRFGGHKGAAGLTLNSDKVERFKELINKAVEHQIGNVPLAPIVMFDGEAHLADLFPPSSPMSLVDELQKIGVWGREFDYPSFLVSAKVEQVVPMGDGTHFRLKLNDSGITTNAVWFNARKSADDSVDLRVGDQMQFLVTPKDNEWRGERNPQLLLSCKPKAAYEPKKELEFVDDEFGGLSL